MNFYWLPDAERELRDLGLSPVLGCIKTTFERFDFESSTAEFGSVSQSESGRVVYYVAFGVDRPTLMDLSRADSLVSELVVRCVRPSPTERTMLQEKSGVIFRGIVFGVQNASDFTSTGLIPLIGEQ